MDPVIMYFGCRGKKCVTFIFQALRAAVTWPPHQMNSVSSKRPAEDFGAAADNVALSLCKHWGPPDRCALIAATSEDAAARSAGWIPSPWRETAEPSASLAGASDLIPGVEPSHWDTECSSLMLSVCPRHPSSSSCPLSRSSVGLIVITKSISSSHENDVTYRCPTVRLDNLFVWD